MKERPILFNAEMVRAILGRKTQTRRVIDDRYQMCRSPEDEPEWFIENCKYGKVGDRLWVRETWAMVHPCQIAEGRYSQVSAGGIPGPPPVAYRIIYRADGEYPRLYHQTEYPYRTIDPKKADGSLYLDEFKPTWNSPMFMPKWASRITLEITNVRCTRIQEISEADACAEGMTAKGYTVWPQIYKDFQDYLDKGGFCYNPEPGRAIYGPQGQYAQLWDQLNTRRGYSWRVNPWVWVIEFKGVCRAQLPGG